MSFWKNFISWFNKDNTLKLDAYVADLATKIYYKELALKAGINLIANTLSLADFKTYEKGKDVKKANYYLFNVQPNPNMSASEFKKKIVAQLILDNECLVLQQSRYLYVADNFQSNRYAFRENSYKDIVVEGFQLDAVYFESQVFHFKLNNHKIKEVVDSLYQDYSKLIAASQNYFKRNSSRRGTLTIPGGYPQTEEAVANLNDLLERRFKRFFEAEGGAVLPLTNELKYEELTSNIGNKGTNESREIRALITDVFDYVAVALQIPPQLLLGSTVDTGKAESRFLTYCIKPLAASLQDEINRKYYSQSDYLEKTYLRVDLSKVRVVEIQDIANALDVLIRTGSYCVDDCLEMLGMERLDTPWSRQRWMTKNYQPIEEAAKGGENNG